MRKQTYTGTVHIDTSPMTFGEFHALTGDVVDEGQDPNVPGYLEMYLDDADTQPDYRRHCYWFAKSTPEATYPDGALRVGMSYDEATAAMDAGLKVSRAGWGCSELLLFKEYGQLFASVVVPKTAGKRLHRKNAAGYINALAVDGDELFTLTPSGNIQRPPPYLSSLDLAVEDWYIVE
jgi:hypothetical protein